MTYLAKVIAAETQKKSSLTTTFTTLVIIKKSKGASEQNSSSRPRYLVRASLKPPVGSLALMELAIFG